MRLRSSLVWPLEVTSGYGVLQSAGLLFFAFAGYARIATLGEEVIEPRRTIPIALAITLLVYTAVTVSVLMAVDTHELAGSCRAPGVGGEQRGFGVSVPRRAYRATVACLGVLLSLLAGVSRTGFAMASSGDLPRYFSAVHTRHKVPHRAELVVGALVIAIVLIADVRGAIGFSSFAVLTYYGIANASALTLPASERTHPNIVAMGGLVGCAVLAFSLPLPTVAQASQ